MERGREKEKEKEIERARYTAHPQHVSSDNPAGGRAPCVHSLSERRGNNFESLK